MAHVFFSYSHADEALRNELEKHLSVLRREDVITTWHDRRIGAGEELHGQINDQLIPPSGMPDSRWGFPSGPISDSMW